MPEFPVDEQQDVGSVVGRVVGTEDSTPLEFAVALAPGAYLQLDDVVATERDVPGVGTVVTSGVVTEVRATKARPSAPTSSSSPTASCPPRCRRSPRS